METAARPCSSPAPRALAASQAAPAPSCSAEATATAATKLNSLSTQLQTAYELTAEIQKLSLAQYLPT